MIRQTHGYDVAEMLGKMISLPAFEPIGLACFAMQAKQARNCIFKGSLSRSIEVGRAVREAAESGGNPADAFAKISEGRVIFRGEVSGHEWKSEGGYMIGINTIKGSGEFTEKALKIWFKNENHMSWLDEKPYIMSPDIIQVMQASNGNPITNADIAPGQSVSVVAIPHKLYQTEEGLKLMGPTHYGFDGIPYVPAQQILGI